MRRGRNMDVRDSSILRRPNFSQEETDALVREVQARSGRIYGHKNRPPRADDVKQAWEEVTCIVNQVCPGILRTVMQCKKRFHDVRRRGKKKLFRPRRQTVDSGGGPSTSVAMSSAEDIASSTLPAISIEGFGGIEVCITDPLAIKQEQQEEEDAYPGKEEVGEPGTEDGPRVAHVHSQDQPLVDMQQGGFGMLEQELGTINSRLQGLESRLQGLEAHLASLSSIDASLKRLADAAERFVTTQETSAPPHPSQVAVKSMDKRRTALIRLPSPNREYRVSPRTKRKE